MEPVQNDMCPTSTWRFALADKTVNCPPDNEGFSPPSRLARWVWWITLSVICLGIPAPDFSSGYLACLPGP